MKIICVGLNYARHAEELRMKQNADPLIFMKPDTALLRPGVPFFVPDWAERFDYELELIFRISRLGRYIDERFAHRYYDAVGLGIDFTARDLQEKLVEAGQPWEICKSFDQSAAISDFVDKNKVDDIGNLNFRLLQNGEEKQRGNSCEMIHSIDKIIAYVSRFFTLRIGDIIFTGTPPGVGGVNIGDRLEGYLGDEKLLDIKIK